MFKVFKCDKCETQILTSEDGKLECCGESMLELVPNSVDASFEKHVPTYEIKGTTVHAKVNHVMEEEHYIEWIAYVSEDSHDVRYFEPYMEAETEFKYVKGAKIYAYCNKHGLWTSEVE